MSLNWSLKKKIISFLLETEFDESPARVAHKAATLLEVIFESDDSLKKLKQELKKGENNVWEDYLRRVQG
ncbi:MAG: hypothetical protein VW438_00285 [Euryarchaeota archaeon]|jgi:hypothetical protein